MRWLRLNGRHADAIAILKKAAKVNKKVLPNELELAPLPMLHNSNAGVLALFRPLKMLLYTAVQGFSW